MNEKRSRGLGSVLAAAAARPLPEEQDERALAAVLATFSAAGAAERAGAGLTAPITALSPVEPDTMADRTGREAARRRSRRVRLVLQGAALFAIFAGTGIAAASTGILPSPVQSFVHTVFGGIGVPGPAQNGTPGNGLSASATPTAGPGAAPDSSASSSASGLNDVGGVGGGATSAPAASASPGASEASLATLCGEVVGGGNSWRTTMNAPDQARLIAAAGSANKVHAYCAQLLHSPGGADATPSSGGSGGSGAGGDTSPSPGSTTHGNGNNGKSKSTSKSAGASDAAASGDRGR